MYIQEISTVFWQIGSARYIITILSISMTTTGPYQVSNLQTQIPMASPMRPQNKGPMQPRKY